LLQAADVEGAKKPKVHAVIQPSLSQASLCQVSRYSAENEI
jgi:hypothetical protein